VVDAAISRYLAPGSGRTRDALVLPVAVAGLLTAAELAGLIDD
jgi:hypothetical protein